MAATKSFDFNNIDYTQTGATAGVIVGLIWSMHKSYGFGKSAVVALVVGAAGAFIGYNYQKYTNL